jgi:glycosyltransferase involved in cell wall biosynthesis
MVMPPVTELEPVAAVEQWGTITHAAEALLADGRWQPEVHARHRTVAAVVERAGVRYRFHASDAALASAVAAAQPDVVHVHGLGWTRLVARLARVGAPLVLQHHGELPFRGRARWGHRLVRRYVAAYLFTGASTGQAQPWIDAGVLRRDARCCEVLEAAAMLPDDAGEPVVLEGEPAVVWVGRLVPGKDPLLALDAFAAAADAAFGGALPDAHLHLLATDRTLEPRVQARLAELGEVGGRIHLHAPVPHHRMRAWLEAADVFFSTSHHEGSGYSLIEAITCGCTPAVTAIPPHLAIVGPEAPSFPPGDAAAAATALVRAAHRSRNGGGPAFGVPNMPSWGLVATQLADAYASVSRR